MAQTPDEDEEKEKMRKGQGESRRRGGLRVERANIQGAEGMRGGIVQEEKESKEAAHEGQQRQHTSDSMKQ